MPAFKDLVGRRFGRLVARSRIRRGQVWAYYCTCDCGEETTVLAGNLTRTKKPTRSCGCLNLEVRQTMSGANSPTYRHGHGVRTGSAYGSPTHQVWRHMKGRCLNPQDSNYPYYGGRGITVCRRWMSFGNFLSDMGERPDGLTIDRIDNDGNYEPVNCRWATSLQQARNTRGNVHYTFLGDTLCVSEAAEKYGVKYPTLLSRLRNGLLPDQAITPDDRRRRYVERRKQINGHA